MTFIREQECKFLTGLSKQTRWRLQKEKKFPIKQTLWDGSMGWDLTEIYNWIENRDKSLERKRQIQQQKSKPFSEMCQNHFFVNELLLECSLKIKEDETNFRAADFLYFLAKSHIRKELIEKTDLRSVVKFVHQVADTFNIKVVSHQEKFDKAAKEDNLEHGWVSIWDLKAIAILLRPLILQKGVTNRKKIWAKPYQTVR
jgi:prophage regulatory protein